MTEYVLTLNEDQAHETLKAVELLMRLKLGQYQELVYNLCDIRSAVKADTVSHIDDTLKYAFSLIYKDKEPTEYKDEEWYRLYNLYQVLRKAIHDAEHPEGTGIDSYEPMQITEEPLPKIKWSTKKGR